MDNIIDAPNPETPSNGGSLWRNLLYTFLGTTISILLTFGTSQLVSMHRQAQDRKMTALMVMGNIERFAQSLDQISDHLSQCDTVATILLSIPQDSLDAPEYQPLIQRLIYAFPAQVLTYDRTAEQIFSNSIETWKNMGNFSFIDNVGNCFSTMGSIEKEYIEFQSRFENATQNVIDHPDNYPGKTILSKSLRYTELRRAFDALHARSSYYRYLAANIRYMNRDNMRLIDIDEEEVMKFVKEHSNDAVESADAPHRDDYTTPHLNADSIPNAKAWLENLVR